MAHHQDFMLKKAAENYMKGKMTISEASGLASLTILEMEKYLVDQGYVSSYSVEDFEKEMKLLNKNNNL